MSRFSDKEKQLFWNLKFHAVLSTNFSQVTEQCYGVFLTSRNLTCTRMKNTPQSRNDLAQRTLQKPSTPQSVKWGRDPGITSTYAKTQDCSILSIPVPMM